MSRWRRRWTGWQAGTDGAASAAGVLAPAAAGYMYNSSLDWMYQVGLVLIAASLILNAVATTPRPIKEAAIEPVPTTD